MVYELSWAELKCTDIQISEVKEHPERLI